MKINKQVIAALNPCADRFNNYVINNQDKDFTVQDFLGLDNITYSDKIWVMTRLMTTEQCIKWSIACADSVISLYEDKYPNDNRPRKAIEAAVAYIEAPTEENRNDAHDAYAAYAAHAAYAAYAAAHAAHDAHDAYAAAHAAYAAAHAAHDAYAAAHDAYAAAHAAHDAHDAYAAYAAHDAHDAYAAYAAHAAYAAAHAAGGEKQQEDLNLLLILEVL
jgi:hypothetical protein